MTHNATIGFRSVLSLGLVFLAGACDDELSDQELIDRSRHAQEHQSSSESSSPSKSDSSKTGQEQARAANEGGEASSERDETSTETETSPSSETASEDTSTQQDESTGPKDDVDSNLPEGRYAHLGFCAYTVRQALGPGSELISSLSGHLQLDDRGRVETIETSTAFPNTESKVMNRYEVVSYENSLVELVNYKTPQSAERTRIEVDPDHNIAALRRDTSGDGSYDKQSLFVYGGAPTDVLISGTAYMLIKNQDSMREAFDMTYDDQGRVVSAEQTQGEKSGRTFEFSYANDYFERVVEEDAKGVQTGLWMVEFDDRGRPAKLKKKLGAVDEFNAIETFDYECDESAR